MNLMRQFPSDLGKHVKATLFMVVVLVSMIGKADYVRTTTSGVFTYYLGSSQSFDNLKRCYIRKITCSSASQLNNFTFPSAVPWASGGSAPAKTPSVYKINSGVLSGNSNLKTVSIPRTITTIGQPCFMGCDNLTSINMTGSISFGAEYDSKDGVLYDSGITILKKYPEGKTGTTFTVPSTVTKLGTCCLINTKLSSLYFQGDAPSYEDDSFTDSHFTIYYPEGKSGWTNPFNGRPAYAIPKTVTGLSSELDSSSDYVYLYWNPNSVATSYIVYRATSSSGAKVQIATTSACNYKDTTATPGTTYWYSVSAVNESCTGASSSSVQGRRKVAKYVVTYAPGVQGIGYQRTATKTYGSSLTLLGAIFTRAGYTQTGWATSEDGPRAYSLGATYSSEAAITLYPSWTVNQYTVTFDANGGSGTMESRAATYGTYFAAPESGFTRKGYVFAGWATMPSGDVVYEPGVAIGNLTSVANGTVALYAKWNKSIVCTPTVSPSAGSTFRSDSCIVTISCATEGAVIYYSTDGTSPRALDAFKYTAGFIISGTTTIKAFAVKDDEKSGLVTAVITKDDSAPVTFASALAASNLGPILTGGDANWTAITDGTAPVGGVSARSGMIGYNASTYLETKVKGAGTLTFWWKASCEPDEWREYTYDHVTLVVDGLPTSHRLDGKSDWEQVSYAFTNDGEHTIRWVYATDGYAASGYEDCAWVNGVTWSGEDWSTAADPIPDIGSNPTTRQIAEALEGFADAKLSANITDGATYRLYREWANKVKAKGGSSAIGAEAVKRAPNAWLSFALCTESLIDKAPTNGQMRVEHFAPTASAGMYDFTVSIDGIMVGSDAVVDNLKKVFGLVGGTTLEPNGLSAENVNITFGTPLNGKVKFTAGPKDSSTGTFFMKVKMMP